MKNTLYKGAAGCLSFLILAGLCASLTVGCASGVCYVDVDSKPTGAVIYVDGERRGQTRSKVELDFGTDPEKRILLQLLKPRYKPVFQYWTFGEVPGKKVFVLEVD